jgi:iron complex transport system ATP-binding protein
MTDALRVRGLCVERSGRKTLDGVDFMAAHGRLSAIVGPNGAGKSTLLKAIAGLLPFSGEIELSGHQLAALAARERARLLAYVPQQTQLRAPMRARDVVAQGGYARGKNGQAPKTHAQEIEAALSTVRALPFADRPFTELSGGEQRRVLLARAVFTGAPLLLLDEPTASLDVQHALSMFALCRKLTTEGRCVVMVLHQLPEALRFADRVLLLHQGRAIAEGAPGDVINVPRVREIYDVAMLPETAPSFDALETADGPDAREVPA